MNIDADVRIEVFEHGQLVSRQWKKNKVTNAGLNLIRDWFLAAGESRTIQKIAIGTGSNAPNLGDTWLQIPLAYFDFEHREDDPGRVRISITIKESEWNGNTLRECALTTGISPTADICYARCTHSPIVKTDTVAIQYTWECRWDS